MASSRVVAPTVPTCVGSMLVGVRAASMSSRGWKSLGRILAQATLDGPGQGGIHLGTGRPRGTGGVVPAMVAQAPLLGAWRGL